MGNPIWEGNTTCQRSVVLLCAFTHCFYCVLPAVPNPKCHCCHNNSMIAPEQHDQGHLV